MKIKPKPLKKNNQNKKKKIPDWSASMWIPPVFWRNKSKEIEENSVWSIQTLVKQNYAKKHLKMLWTRTLPPHHHCKKRPKKKASKVLRCHMKFGPRRHEDDDWQGEHKIKGFIWQKKEKLRMSPGLNFSLWCGWGEFGRREEAFHQAAC